MRATILDGSSGPAEHAYVVRRGSVELVIEGRLLDLMGEGELFGFTSVLAEEAIGFVARAAGHARLPDPQGGDPPGPGAPGVRPVRDARDERARPLPRRPAGRAAFVVGGPPGGRAVRAPALVCPPSMSVQEAARQMAEAGATCVVVDTGDGLGIVTDRDIRTRAWSRPAPCRRRR